MRYIIDSRYFDGTCLTSMSDDMHSDYGGETLEALREREKNPYLVTVSPVRMTLLVKRYTRALSTLFEATSSRKCTDVSVRIMRTSVSSPSEDHLWRKSATP